MGERGFCEPDWKPDGTFNKFMDGLEYGLFYPVMTETLAQYSAHNTEQRKKEWQKEKEACEKNAAWRLPIDIEEAFRNAKPEDFKGMQPSPGQMRQEEEDFYNDVYSTALDGKDIQNERK